MRGDQAGFTLTELLVTLAVVGLILGGALSMFGTGSTILQTASARSQAQQTVRVALDRMTREMRAAGYDPTAVPPDYNFDAVTAFGATTVTLQSDLDGNGALDAPAGCGGGNPTERVRYRLAGTTLWRSPNPDDPGCDEMLSGGVEAFALTYLQDDGVTAAATGAAVRTVVVSLRARAESATTQSGSVVMADRIRLRNR